MPLLLFSVNEKCAVNNGLCSTFCLPTPFGRTCACEEGVLLEKDGRTCKGGESLVFRFMWSTLRKESMLVSTNGFSLVNRPLLKLGDNIFFLYMRECKYVTQSKWGHSIPGKYVLRCLLSYISLYISWVGYKYRSQV